MGPVDVIPHPDDPDQDTVRLELGIAEIDITAGYQLGADRQPIPLGPYAVQFSGERELPLLTLVQVAYRLPEHVPARPGLGGVVAYVGCGKGYVKDGVLVSHLRIQGRVGKIHAVLLSRYDLELTPLVYVLDIELTARQTACLEDHGHGLAGDQAILEIEVGGNR